MQEYLGGAKQNISKFNKHNALRDSTVGPKGSAATGGRVTNSSMDSRKTRRRFQSMDLATTHGFGHNPWRSGIPNRTGSRSWHAVG